MRLEHCSPTAPLELIDTFAMPIEKVGALGSLNKFLKAICSLAQEKARRMGIRRHDKHMC